MQKATRVLIVEDDEISRIVTERFLTGRGFEVETAIDGQKALALLGNEVYDVVLMDIELPKINGLHLARQMKKYSHTHDIPIIALSAHAASADFSHEHSQDIAAFLSKPFQPEELLDVIIDVTTGHQPELDWPGLLKRTNADMDFLKEISDLFYRNSFDLINQIEESSNFSHIKDMAHRLKGSAATAGALRLSDIAREIQRLSQEKDIDGIQAKCKSFKSHLTNYYDCLAAKGIQLTGNRLVEV